MLKEPVTNEPRPDWMGEARGPMALPGQYSATLNVRENGSIRELAAPVTFTVTKGIEKTIEKATPAEILAFQQKVTKAEAAVTAASLTIGDLQKQLEGYRTALDRTSDRAGLEAQFAAIRAELFSLDEALDGKRAQDQMGATPATISSRVASPSSAAPPAMARHHKAMSNWAMRWKPSKV